MTFLVILVNNTFYCHLNGYLLAYLFFWVLAFLTFEKLNGKYHKSQLTKMNNGELKILLILKIKI